MQPALKVVLRSPGYLAARDFYENLLGLEVVDEWDEAHGAGCLFRVGEGMLELNEAQRDDYGPDRFDVQMEVDDVASWVAKLDGRWEFVGPKTHPWGETTLRFHDPDGTLLTIFSSG